jgi:hypothetical protein
MSGGIQALVTTQPAPAVVGDFASANPRFAANFGPYGAVAGPSGLAIGLFAWAAYSTVDGDSAPSALNNFGGGPVSGFVGRAQQGLITTYLSDAGVTIPAGFQATVFSGGDFWVKNNGAGQALPGMKAYANFTNGQASFAAPGAPTTTTQTSATIAAGTGATFTGSINGNILTITGTVTNTLYIGAVLSGTNVATGTQITGQLTGTTGAAGTYTLNIGEQSVASESLTATPYLAAGTGGSGIVVGSTITAAGGTVTGTVIGGVVTAIITAGTNVVVALPNPGTGTMTTGTITFEQNVETTWYAVSSGLTGELVKISNNPGVTH